MLQQKIDKLKEYGFKPYDAHCELAYAFKNSAYYLDTKMLVEGSHATDYAEIIYAEEESFVGLCYYSSLMEYILTDFSNHNVEKMLKKIGKTLGTSVLLEDVGGYPMIVKKCNDADFERGSIKNKVSDMLKIVGILDYLLQQKLDYLRKRN